MRIYCNYIMPNLGYCKVEVMLRARVKFVCNSGYFKQKLAESVLESLAVLVEVISTVLYLS